MKHPFIARQGDVLIVAVPKLPAETIDIPRDGQGRIVLAEGEATGHHHAIHDRRVRFLADGRGAGRYLDVGSDGASVVHEEHDTIALAPGRYEVRRQREYSPEAIRTVAD